MIAPALAPPAHEALFYTSEEELVATAGSFVRSGCEAGEPVLVLLSGSTSSRVRATLDGIVGVELADMETVGRNPSRIIAAVHDFVARHRGNARSLRLLGEPIWPGRSPAEVAECHRHESLLDMALGRDPSVSILCPYDAATLDRDVLDRSRSTHPFVIEGGVRAASPAYRPFGPGALDEDPLPAPPSDARTLAFGADSLEGLRATVGAAGGAGGLDPERAARLVLAVNELATNSVVHAGGAGVVRVWADGTGVVAQVEDAGHIVDPLAGRIRAHPDAVSGRGLWMVNQLCDLVQLRSTPQRTVVRVHLRLADTSRQVQPCSPLGASRPTANRAGAHDRPAGAIHPDPRAV